MRYDDDDDDDDDDESIRSCDQSNPFVTALLFQINVCHINKDYLLTYGTRIIKNATPEWTRHQTTSEFTEHSVSA